MSLFKQLFNFYINASIHVALAVYSFIRITEFYLDLPYNETFNYTAFFATITGYNFVKYAGVAKLHHRSLTDNLKKIQLFSFICFLAMLYYAIQLPLQTILYSIPFQGLTLLYAIPFLSGFQKSLRAISFLKIVVVAVVWVGFTVLLPIVDATRTPTLEVLFMGIQRFIIVVVLILPFDIRDVQFDAISLQTIPKKIGLENTKRLGLFLLLCSLVLEFMMTPNAMTKNVFMLIFFAMIVLLMRSQEKQSTYYSSFWVEAIPVFWWLILEVTMP